MEGPRAPFWLATAALAVLSARADAQIVTGPAVAIDGDSLEMTDTRIRLFGIDAPEKRQTCQRSAEAWACGTEAGRYLRELISAGHTECRGLELDVYGRMVATCRASSLDVGLAMLEAGFATALPNASPEYRDAESRARANKVGIWGTAFETPAAWRAAHPRDDASASQTLARVQAPARRAEAGRSHRNAFGCAIKGNRSQRGDWIYHLPGSRYYEATRPEELFCTEEQAMAAGYRRSRAD